jgi:methionine synthase I (cobalamin-dependent)/5,10-methylenetetrahydrofolate reductase
MNTFLDSLNTHALLADGATGSYLFETTGRLSEGNHIYELLIRDRPELIRDLHYSYLQAGARCLTTNTFSANSTHLAPHGAQDQVDRLNRAAVRLARQVIDDYQAKNQTTSAQSNPSDASPDPTGVHFILGSIGPTLKGHESPRELRAIYSEQLKALLDEKIDALLLETFTSLPHLMTLLDLIHSFDSPPPVIVHMSLNQTDAASGWNQNPRVFVKTAADMGAQVVGVNCCSPWEATAFLDAIQDIPAVKEGHIRLSAMPNAGGFRRIGHRFMSSVNPEFMGKLARTFSERGVSLIGGCCEVHPPHINEMHAYLHSRQQKTKTAVHFSVALAPAKAADKRHNGPFSRKLFDGEFVVSVEMLPPRNTRPKLLADQIKFIETLAASGLADAVDVTDGSRGIPLMPPGDFIGVARQRLGWSDAALAALEFIPHFTTRDLNTMGLQSRLIGYYAQAIHNVLIITGDPPKMSPTYPRSTAVFDMDSAALIRHVASALNAGVDFGGQPLGKQKDPRTHFTIGSGFEPEALDQTAEVEKLQRKLDHGVDYIMTQPAFRADALEILAPYRTASRILVGVLILTSLDHARRVGEVPGVLIPDEIYTILGAYATKEDQAKAGLEWAAEQVRWIKAEGWPGLYLMSPSSHRPVIEVLQTGLS